MSTKTLNLTGKEGKIFGTLTPDEKGQSWNMAVKTEPGFERKFASEQDGFYFWYTRFDPSSGHLRN